MAGPPNLEKAQFSNPKNRKLNPDRYPRPSSLQDTDINMATAERDPQTWQVPEQTSSVTLTEFINSIKRNKGVFWTTLLVCLAIGVAICLILPARYSSRAEMLVEGTNGGGISPSPENIAADITVPGAVYPLTTQVELIQTPKVYFDALEEAGIERPQTLEEYRALPQVSVVQKKESNVINLLVDGGNKEQVKKLAEAYPRAFQRFSDSKRTEAAARAQQFVEQRLKEEADALKQAETEFAAFKQSKRVVDSNSEIQFRQGQLAQARLTFVESQGIEQAALANAGEAERALARTPKQRPRLIDLQNYERVNQSREQLNLLKVRRAELVQTYKDTAPQVKEVDAQIKVQEDHIADLESSLKATLMEDNPEYDIAVRRLSDANANKDAAISRRTELGRIVDQRQSELDALGSFTQEQREFERRIGLHTQSIVNMEQLRDRVALRNNQVRSTVEPVTGAIFAEQTQPNWAVTMAIASVLGLALAIVFSIVRDSSLDKVNSREEAYVLSGHSNLSNIPDRSRSKHPIITNPQTNLAFEAYRVLRSNIAVHGRASEMKSLTVSSTLRREGKSVVASNLAIAFVLNGQRTILVDADMRHPTIHTLFGLQDKPGLGDLLIGSAGVNDVLQPTTVDGLYVVTCGTIPANATEVMGSPRMQEIINMLTAQADMLVVDSPHVIGLADAPSLAAATDASILVWQPGRASKSEFREAVANLEASSPAFLGYVANRVSAKDAHITGA